MFAPMDRTLPRMLMLQAARHGSRKLVSVGDTCWTVQEACTIAACRGGALLASGIKRGDRVAALVMWQ